MTQDRIHAGLIAVALRFEPLHHVGIEIRITGVLRGGMRIKLFAQSALVVAGLSASRAAMRSISA